MWQYFLDGPDSVDKIDAPVLALFLEKTASLGLVDLDTAIPGFSEGIGGDHCLGPFGPPGDPSGGLDGMVSFPICFGEGRDDLQKYLEAHVKPVTGMDYDAFVAGLADSDPSIKGMFDGPIAAGADFPGYKDAISTHRPALQAAYGEAFKHCDAVAFPCVRHVAVKIDAEETDAPGTFPAFIHNTDPGSNSGFPGVTIPLGSVTVDGDICMVGLGLDGASGNDTKLLQIALALQTQLNG